LDGVIVIDKPEGWTSHDVVNKVRRIAQTKKVGHLGTLDPIATGVLPLVIERATRLAQFYTRSDKIYEGIVRFGWSTSSYDRGGEPTSEKAEVHVTAEQLEAALEPFRRLQRELTLILLLGIVVSIFVSIVIARGIARPSGVCAAAITCSVVSPPDEPPPPGVGLGGGGVGFTTGGRRGRRQIAAVSDGATLSV